MSYWRAVLGNTRVFKNKIFTSSGFTTACTIVSPLTYLYSNLHKHSIRYFTTELPSKSLKRATEIQKNHVLPFTEYAKQRNEFQALRRQIKAVNRIEIGPYASITFETYDLMWIQVHEILNIEKGGELQINEELEAYNPLIPKGNNLVITLMFEIDDKKRRDTFLRKAVGVEKTLKLKFNNHIVTSEPVKDEDSRISPAGITSAVHFLQFKLNAQQIMGFKSSQNSKVYIEIDHTSYPHTTALKSELIDTLKKLL